MAVKRDPVEERSRVEIRWVPLGQAMQWLWKKNSKRHDHAGIRESIRRYGFRDAPIYDATLGAFVVGNGRVEVLAEMKSSGEAPPVNVFVEDEDWMLPVQFGIDAATLAEAVAFGIDHNNLTAAGGAGGQEMLRSLWDEAGLHEMMAEIKSASGRLPDTLVWELNAGDFQEIAAPEGDRATNIKEATFIRPVIPVAVTETVELALRATGLPNRGQAFLALCEFYLAQKG